MVIVWASIKGSSASYAYGSLGNSKAMGKVLSVRVDDRAIASKMR
jgi:hypothetical protein